MINNGFANLPTESKSIRKNHNLRGITKCACYLARQLTWISSYDKMALHMGKLKIPIFCTKMWKNQILFGVVK